MPSLKDLVGRCNQNSSHYSAENIEFCLFQFPVVEVQRHPYFYFFLASKPIAPYVQNVGGPTWKRVRDFCKLCSNILPSIALQLNNYEAGPLLNLVDPALYFYGSMKMQNLPAELLADFNATR